MIHLFYAYTEDSAEELNQKDDNISRVTGVTVITVTFFLK